MTRTPSPTSGRTCSGTSSRIITTRSPACSKPATSTENLTVRHHDRLSWIIGAALRGGDRRILFQRVPEPKTVKNRWHIDLNVGRERVAEEVARIEGLGGVQVREVEEWGQYHVVMQDPEGNEFCVQ